MAHAKWDVAAQEHAESLERLALQHKVELAEIRKQHATLQQVPPSLRHRSGIRRTARSNRRGRMRHATCQRSRPA